MSVLRVDEDESLMSDADISESCTKERHTSTHRNTITTNHAWRRKHRSVQDQREADERHQQTIIARTT